MKIAVGLSGGIDSSATLMRLYEDGHDLVGITLKTTAETQEYGKCCSLQDLYDAKKLCQRLGIRHYVLDVKQDFDQAIIQYFIHEYFQGKTPNPCIYCNPLIKFPFLLEAAQGLGYERIATGHYAVLEHRPTKTLLKCAKDPQKDQSYFLSRLTPELLKRSIFPLGDTEKRENLQFLKDRSLEISEKKESQSLCFISGRDYTSFLKSKSPIPLSEGKITNTEGEILGTHKGIIHYTIGQRRGLGIATGKPTYVRHIDPQKNTIEIGEKPYHSACTITKINWLGDYDFENPTPLKVKVRYLHEGEYALLTQGSEDIRIDFQKAVFSLSKGQSAVGYRGEQVIFSGIINTIDP